MLSLQYYNLFDMGNNRLCYLTRNYRGVKGSGNKAKTDNEDTLQEMGAVNLGLRRTFHDNAVLKFLLDLAGVVLYCFRLRKGDVVVLQYPVKKYFSFLCRVAHLRGAKVVALIHDLGSMRRKKLTIHKEINRLMHADYVIASNEVMRMWLSKHGYTHPLGALGLFDYRSVTCHQEKAGEQKGPWTPSIVYAGALAMRKNAFILKMPDIIEGYRMHVYGTRSGLPGLKEHEGLVFHDFMPADQFIQEVEGDFGLVWDGDSVDSCTGSFGEYLLYNSPHKVSFYLRAGMPVIIWEEAALAKLVEKEGIGFSIGSIGQLGERLASITDEQMTAMRDNVKRVSDSLARGDFFKKALEKALGEMAKK